MNLADLSSKAKQVISTVAPLIGTALGGPLGGLAGSLVSKALGTTDTAATEAALAVASPDQLVALKKADDDFQAQMKTLEVSEEQLQYGDLASARARDVAVKDWTPSALAFGITCGFFGVLAWLLWKGVPRDTGGDVLLVMLGALGASWNGVVTFYFGSSVGAQKNAEALATIAKQP